MCGLVPQLGIEPEAPALGVCSLNQWITRGVPGNRFVCLFVFRCNSTEVILS